MSDTYAIKDPMATYFITFQVVNGVDLFTLKKYRDIVVKSFNSCIREKDLSVHAWVIMSSHVHCILGSKGGKLANLVKEFKRNTAVSLLECILLEPENRREWMLQVFHNSARRHERKHDYQVWNREIHALMIDPLVPSMKKEKMNFIHENPVRAGFVYKPENYLYSSARDYAGTKGLIEIDMW